ncbi:MAG: peptidylprolyl isomerase [Chloroflexota bacterium]|jgi:FKBP-type peptidyl-prolyl cis-trans isomerase SlyD|nr:peptidylprolyl isomerase [Chloroflexota bacterium]
MAENKGNSIEKDVVVTLHYNLEVDGNEIDSGPIQFLYGHGNIIPGLEDKIEGMELGEEKEVLVKAKNAYGFYDEDLEIDVSLDSFPEDFEIELGRPMRLQDGKGHAFTGVAIAITDDHVKLNLNHPLAGQDLLFKTKVMELRPATEEEIQRGRLANGCSGCASDDCSDCS